MLISSPVEEHNVNSHPKCIHSRFPWFLEKRVSTGSLETEVCREGAAAHFKPAGYFAATGLTAAQERGCFASPPRGAQKYN